MSRKKQKQLFDAACEAQQAFWQAIRELEIECGFDIEDTAQDLSQLNLAHLRKQARKRDREQGF
jgi:hypothetical protein